MTKWLFFGAVLAIVMIGSFSAADAAIIDVLRYNLGEPGSFSGQFPLDTVGGRNQTNTLGIYTPGGVLDVIAPGSTSATRYNGVNAGSYGANSSGLPSDNFAVELWARTSNVNQVANDLFALNGNTVGSLTFRGGNGVWAAHLFGVNWIGSAAGAGQTATNDDWTNLAVIRNNGISTFYIDGVAQAGTTNGTPSLGVATAGIHIGVTPGGATYFNGDLDSIRIFTFNPNVDNPVAALSINFVPEPGSLAIWTLLGVAGLGFVWWKRRKPTQKQ